MNHRVCPWWLGYFLASPVRRWRQKPERIISPHVRPGMIVFEPGPGMGFFTLELARFVGLQGKVVAVDIQQKMLNGLNRRATKAGLQERIDARLASQQSMNIGDLAGKVDFTLAFAVVHELPAIPAFFAEASQVAKPQSTLLLAEPRGHISQREFAQEIATAAQHGFEVDQRLDIPRSEAVLLRKK